MTIARENGAGQSRWVSGWNLFRLYLPPDASEARRTVQRSYEEAVNAMNAMPWPTDAEAWQAAREAIDRARRAYGEVLLWEDKLRRPYIYATT